MVQSELTIGVRVLRNRVYSVSKKYIQLLYIFMVLASVALPLLLMSISLKKGVTFEQSFVMLLVILGSVIFITLFHEGRKVIQTIQNRQLELTETRLMIMQDNKKELIFFDEVELISVYENRGGHVSEVILKTVYGSITRLKHYDNLKDLATSIHCQGQVCIMKRKGEWFPLGAAGLLAVGTVVYLLN